MKFHHGPNNISTKYTDKDIKKKMIDTTPDKNVKNAETCIGAIIVMYNTTAVAQIMKMNE
jgi:hypothetical protein